MILPNQESNIQFCHDTVLHTLDESVALDLETFLAIGEVWIEICTYPFLEKNGLKLGPDSGFKHSH